MEEKETIVDHPITGVDNRYVFPYKRSAYPYLLLVSFAKPMGKAACEALFEAFPLATITTQGTVIIPRKTSQMTAPLHDALEEVQALGLIGFAIQDNPQE